MLLQAGGTHALQGDAQPGAAGSSLEKPALCGVNRTAESGHQARPGCGAPTNAHAIMKTKLFQRFSVPLKYLILPLLDNKKEIVWYSQVGQRWETK